MPDIPIRKYLEERERELSNRLSFARATVALIEAELNDVQRAKAALPPEIGSPPGTLNLPPITQSSVDPSWAQAVAPALRPGAFSLNGSQTIKQMIMYSLNSDPFARSGASANELLEFIRDVFGREIERTSLSPQLSRLKEQGRVASAPDGKWRLAKNTLTLTPFDLDPILASDEPKTE